MVQGDPGFFSDPVGKFKKFVSNIWGVVVVLFMASIFIGGIGILGIRLFAATKVENYQVAYKYDLMPGKGQIEILRNKNQDGSYSYERGWVLAWPILVKVHTVDLRPMQVCINANQRVLNCKLVQFNPEGLELFLSWHGRDDYEGPGNSSMQVTTNFSEILKSYAYDGSGKTYPFLTVLRELKPEEVGGDKQ